MSCSSTTTGCLYSQDQYVFLYSAVCEHIKRNAERFAQFRDRMQPPMTFSASSAVRGGPRAHCALAPKSSCRPPLPPPPVPSVPACPLPIPPPPDVPACPLPEIPPTTSDWSIEDYYPPAEAETFVGCWCCGRFFKMDRCCNGCFGGCCGEFEKSNEGLISQLPRGTGYKPVERR